MECNVWNEKGLLHLSGELESMHDREFLRHVEACSICKAELDACIKEEKAFFTTDMLGVEPSTAIDEEILRVCSRGIQPIVSTASPFSFARKILVAVVLLVIGFGGGTYFVSVKMASQSTRGDLPTAMDKRTDAQTASVATTERAPAAALDTNEESASLDSLPQGGKKKGNLSLQGVYPVDLNDNE